MEHAQAPKKGASGGSEPRLSVKLALLSEAEASSSAALPECVIASPAAARVLGLYRMLLAEGRGSSEVRALCPKGLQSGTTVLLKRITHRAADNGLGCTAFHTAARHTALWWPCAAPKPN